MTYMDVLILRVHDCMDAGGRVKQEARTEDAQDDHMDVGGRILPGANIE